jgi:hypothetical protein
LAKEFESYVFGEEAAAPAVATAAVQGLMDMDDDVPL